MSCVESYGLGVMLWVSALGAPLTYPYVQNERRLTFSG